MLEAIIKRLKSNKRGISNVLVVLLSLVLVVVIVANVVLWSYQMNQLDWEKMQENLQITNVEHYFSWFTSTSEYVLENGSKVGGTYRDTWGAGGTYETFKEGAISYQNTYYHPDACQMIGSTRHVSGLVSNLQNDDDVYMQFRSYISATSAMSKTNAFIAYRSDTGIYTLSSPKFRTWDGESAAWSGENEMANSGSPVRRVRVASCPKSEKALEKIIVTLSDDGYLDAYVFDGASWSVTNNIGYVGTTANTYRPFDVAYETASGEALLVYGILSTDPSKDLAYRIWSPTTGWSAEYYIDDAGHTTDIRYHWVSLASNPKSESNEITMVAIDSTNSDANGWVWDGSSWGAMYELETTVSTTTRECIAVAYETLSGRAWTAVGSGITLNTFSMRSQTNGVWNTTKENPSVGATPYWCTLKSDPSSNRLLLVSVDASSDLNTLYYGGAGSWIAHSEHDNAVNTNAQRCADFAWESSGNRGLLVWGTTNNRITYKTFTAPNTWSDQADIAATGSHRWVQLKTNPRNISGDVRILGATLGSNNVLSEIRWNGSTLYINIGLFTANTATYTYECFEIEFQNFGDPIEFTSEVEFTGISDVLEWTQLTWTVDSSFTTNDVNATFQLYNYTAGRYSTSSDSYGFINGIIGTTDMTVNQTVTVNPEDFRNATTGEWKVKVKGVKATSTPFDWNADWIELKVIVQGNAHRLGFSGNFVLDMPAASFENISSVEFYLRFRASDVLEDWFLEAYNWTSKQYDELLRMQPATEFNHYAADLTNTWQDYVNINGTLKVKFCDALSDANLTTVDIDFFAVKIEFKGILFSFKNAGASTVHIVSIWIMNATSHMRYNESLFINSGETMTHIREDIVLPDGNFSVKVVTERGNIAAFIGG